MQPFTGIATHNTTKRGGITHDLDQGNLRIYTEAIRLAETGA